MTTTVINASAAVNGLRAGVASGEIRVPGDVAVVVMPTTSRLEVFNLGGGDPLWVVVNAPGDDFPIGALGTEVVDPGECVELFTTGAPRVVLKAEHRARWQVRRLA